MAGETEVELHSFPTDFSGIYKGVAPFWCGCFDVERQRMAWYWIMLCKAV